MEQQDMNWYPNGMPAPWEGRLAGSAMVSAPQDVTEIIYPLVHSSNDFRARVGPGQNKKAWNSTRSAMWGQGLPCGGRVRHVRAGSAMWGQVPPHLCRVHHVGAGSTTWVQALPCGCRLCHLGAGSTTWVQGLPCGCRLCHMGAGSVMWMQGPKHLCHFALFSQDISRELGWK